jgi:CRP-like cAMP-binding protein
MADGSGRTQSPVVAKLSHFGPLSDEDVRALDALCSREERFEAGAEIVREGATPRSAFVLTHGMACRYRLLPSGERQILAFLLPGDVCDLHVCLLRTMDHSIGALVQTRLAAIEWNTTIALLARHPRVAAALWWSALQEEAIQRERIVALGRRNARGRLAYLLCELVWRQIAIGQSDDHAIQLPLTQIELADTLGLTSVHVNRIVQEFRRNQLISLEKRRLALLDVKRLQEIAGLNQDYLHLGGAPEEVVRHFDQLERDRAGADLPYGGGRD